MAQVVIDANIGLALVVNLPYSQAVEQKLTAWREQDNELTVPALWWYEVVSALRKAVQARLLTSRDALAALDDLTTLGIVIHAARMETHRSALAWAERLRQVAAYDSQYLALAEKLGCDFWTADKRLAQNAKQLGLRWVQWIGIGDKD
jgi:predicted nucleic acid-binding protein